mmetsp:Transcript_42983/g.109995  ORF Transcript_42983/g.109995 Transcript_42983/m.109995 type:complete len:658 (+) Transcript_42983:162-2135(+)
MGSFLSRPAPSWPKALPPAEEVALRGAPYELRTLQAPTLGGWALQLFVALLVDSPMWHLIAPTLLRRSGMPQVLRELFLPESPMYHPTHPRTRRGEAPAKGLVLITCTPDNFAYRANLAAKLCPSFQAPLPDGWEVAEAEEGEGGGGPEPLESPVASRAARLKYRPSIRDFNQAYKSGRLTPSEAMEATLQRIRESEAMSPPMAFFISLDEADVRAQAAASTERWAASRPLSVLDGVPMAVKDDADQLPYPTTMGTCFMGAIRKVKRNAQHVDALRAAGAILLGKANMHEIGLGITGWNSHYRPARNPYAPSRHTGGSSSGCAALVAAGLCPVAIGCDGGGSIRIPAAFCGVYGLMPTYGRNIELHKGPKASTFGTCGPIAGCVEDLAIVYAATSHFLDASWADAQRVPPTWTLPPPLMLPSLTRHSGPQDLSGVRIGVYRKWFEDADAQVVAVCDAAVERLEGMGAKVVDICIPELEACRVAHTCLIGSELGAFANGLADANPGLGARYSLDLRPALRTARGFTAADVIQAQKIRRRMTILFDRAFADVDVIVSPTTAITAPAVPGSPLGQSNLKQLSEVMRFVVGANLVGLPAMSVPVGYDAAGLPVGLQLLGPAWSEAQLIHCASKLESALGPARRPQVCLGAIGSTLSPRLTH